MPWTLLTSLKLFPPGKASPHNPSPVGSTSRPQRTDITTAIWNLPSNISPGTSLLAGAKVAVHTSSHLGMYRGCNSDRLVVMLPSVLINSLAVSSVALGTESPKEWGAIGGNVGEQERKKPPIAC